MPPRRDLARGQARPLADLVVEMAKLPYDLPAYPHAADEPVQGTSSFQELPGFGLELVGHLQGKTRKLRLLDYEDDVSSRSQMLRSPLYAI